MMGTDKPNILLVMADDVGWFDIGAYHRGMMGVTSREVVCEFLVDVCGVVM